MLTPEDGIPEGSLFGYGPQSLNEQLWTKDHGTFSLGLEGDNMFLYCLDFWNRIRFLSAFSNVGSWQSPFLDASVYGQNGSALPVVLRNNTITLPHKDNYYYNGERDARIQSLRRSIRDADQWVGDDSLRFSIGMGINQVQAPPSSARSMFSCPIHALALAVGCFTAWVAAC